MATVLYPGSFDPITKGHMSIINQASILFDEVVIAILHNPSKKQHLFTVEERLDMIKELYRNNPKIKIVTSTLAAVDVAKENNCKAIVRGLRSVTDFDSEIQLALVNRDLSDGIINTICLFAENEFQYYSSTIVREVYNLEKDFSQYVDPIIAKRIYAKEVNHGS